MATTVSTKNVKLAKTLGTDVVIDYRPQNYEEHISGYDIVLDTLGKVLDLLAAGKGGPGKTVVEMN
ncbi:hypothetical protein [Rothia nasisuis]|uniref:hypothetical protein n=1 Tax=Rothia nasisuis TaxID=2109647 RepID=UPI001F2AEB87|nr:hypothetical protein [Rothia nasisuis]